MAINKCLICENDFYIKPCHIHLGYGKYCSRNCQSIAQRKGSFVKCHLCKKDIWRMPSSLARSKSGFYFCSKNCSLKWKNSTLSSNTNHPLWRSGVSVYRNIMKRTNGAIVCKQCGINDERLMVVHHVDHNRNNNDVVNLIWLCRNCHYLIHNY